MNLRDVELFIVLAETCNLSQVGRRLGMSAMSVSRHLAQLEKDLGARLFQRTTRAVSLTSEGEEFLPYARTMMEAEQGARIMFSEDAGGASGLLKITAPSGIGRRYILPLLPDLMERNPKMKIDLNLSDDVVDIVGQGVRCGHQGCPAQGFEPDCPQTQQQPPGPLCLTCLSVPARDSHHSGRTDQSSVFENGNGVSVDICERWEPTQSFI